MHHGGRSDIAGLDWGGTTRDRLYSDSKLLVTTLAVAVARLWPDVYSNAVDPGWVPTRMGGPGAPDDLRLGHLTQEWLATSDEPEARSTGRILVPQATPQSTPGGPRRGVPRRAPHRLGALHRHAADLSRFDCCFPWWLLRKGGASGRFKTIHACRGTSGCDREQELLVAAECGGGLASDHFAWFVIAAARRA